MKALTLIITMIAFITLSSYTQKDNVDKLLQKKDTRNEVFNKIMNNRELMLDFMNAMHGNQHAMTMWNQNNSHMQNNGTETNNSYSMMGNGSMMGGSYGNQMMGSTGTNNKGNNNSYMGYGQMMNQMMDNPQLMQGFMTSMMNTYGQDSTFVNNMAKIMAGNSQLMNRAMHDYRNQNGTMGMNGSLYGNGMHHVYSGS
jgi:hypothetical protein